MCSSDLVEENSVRNPAPIMQDDAFDEARLQGLSQDQLIDLFIDELVKAKETTISEVERVRLAEKLKDAVMMEILLNLPDYLVNKINESYDNGTASEEMFDEAVEEAGIDTNRIAEKVMIKFRDDYLNDKEDGEEQ